MANYFKYLLEDGSELLVAADEGGGLQPAARGDTVKEAKAKFEEELAKVKSWAAVLRRQLGDMDAEQVEITFGVKAMGELGLFAVGKCGAEANYQVTLKWSNKKGE